MSPPYTIAIWGRLELDLLLWRRSSISPIVVFVAILLLISIEPSTPVPAREASQWEERPSSSNDDHYTSEMAGAPPVGRRARTTMTTSSDYVRTTLLFGAYSSPRRLVVSVPCPCASCVPWITPQRNCPSRTLQTCSLCAQLACFTATPRAAGTSPKIARRAVLLIFAFWG